MGRKPKAPGLKVLSGTARPDREAPDAPEYDLIEQFPEPPQYLNPDGVKMWSELGPQLVAARVLQVVDLYALTQLCFAWQRMVQKAKAGIEPTSAEDTALKGMLSEFGMTPAARRKVAAGDSKAKANKFKNGGPRSA